MLRNESKRSSLGYKSDGILLKNGWRLTAAAAAAASYGGGLAYILSLPLFLYLLCVYMVYQHFILHKSLHLASAAGFFALPYLVSARRTPSSNNEIHYYVHFHFLCLLYSLLTSSTYIFERKLDNALKGKRSDQFPYYYCRFLASLIIMLCLFMT